MEGVVLPKGLLYRIVWDISAKQLFKFKSFHKGNNMFYFLIGKIIFVWSLSYDVCEYRYSHLHVESIVMWTTYTEVCVLIVDGGF